MDFGRVVKAAKFSPNIKKRSNSNLDIIFSACSASRAIVILFLRLLDSQFHHKLNYSSVYKSSRQTCLTQLAAFHYLV